MTRFTLSAQAFLDARELLLRHRTDYERAYQEFTWPKLDTLSSLRLLRWPSVRRAWPISCGSRVSRVETDCC